MTDHLFFFFIMWNKFWLTAGLLCNKATAPMDPTKRHFISHKNNLGRAVHIPLSLFCYHAFSVKTKCKALIYPPPLLSLCHANFLGNLKYLKTKEKSITNSLNKIQHKITLCRTLFQLDSKAKDMHPNDSNSISPALHCTVHSES
jgi:hypothetical protein